MRDVGPDGSSQDLEHNLSVIWWCSLIQIKPGWGRAAGAIWSRKEAGIAFGGVRNMQSVSVTPHSGIS